LFQLDQGCRYIFQRTAEQAIGYDSRPKHISIGDFDRNGHLDLVVVNSGSDSIGIFLGFGNGSFSDQITHSIGFGSKPYAVVVGNFNNDTYLDLAVANFGTNSISVLLGCGNGSFTKQISTSLNSSRPLSIAAGDFNKDKKLDIIVANYGTSDIILLYGFNNGSFRVIRRHDMGYDSIPYAIAIADFNQDKKLDIAVVNYGTSILTILLAKNNDESFTIQQYSTGNRSYPSSIATGDLNDDSYVDIAITYSLLGTIGIFFGTGKGTFANMFTLSIDDNNNSRLEYISIVDFTHDSKPDIVVIDSMNNNIIILENNANKNFTIATIHSTGHGSDSTSFAIDDFTHDHVPDIAITNNATNNILVLTTYKLQLVANHFIYESGEDSGPTSVAVGDFNHDNYSDIVVGNLGTNTVGIFLNLGNGTFADQIIYSTGDDSTPYFVTIDDINYDNALDIIAVLYDTSEIFILTGYGNGSFDDGTAYSLGSDCESEAGFVKDLNRDGYLDIVVANSLCGLSILFGNRDGSFSDAITYTYDVEFYPKYVAVADFNEDNLVDILACDFNNNGLAISFGQQDESFDNYTIFQTEDRMRCVVVGDLNNDNHIDIVYVSQYYNFLGILLGHGDGTFADLIEYFIGGGTWPWFVHLADFNNDSILDIVITTAYDNSANVFFGIGNGSFTDKTRFTTDYGSHLPSVASGDFNNDNQLDIVVVNEDLNDIAVFILNYQRIFLDENSYFTGSGPHPYSVALGDFNNDNQSDIVVANSGNDNIQLFLNDTQHLTYSTGFQSYPQFVNVFDLNQDTHVDIAVANNRNDRIHVFLGFGNGTFDLPSTHLTGSDSFPIAIAISDFNNDNWLDMVVVNNGTNNIGIFLGFNYTIFSNDTIAISGPSASPEHVIVDDFNNDNHCDIIFTSSYLQYFGIYLGNGNGTFREKIITEIGDYDLNSIAKGDFNNDSRLDIVLVYDDVGIYLGDGNGNFKLSTLYTKDDSSELQSVAVDDFNRDNILDLVITYDRSNTIDIYIGYGNGTFKKSLTYKLRKKSRPISVVVNDINHDKIVDLIVVDRTWNCLAILFGNGNGTFKNAIYISTGPEPFRIATGDINNDTWIDIVVAYNDRDILVLFNYDDNNGTFLSQRIYSTGPETDPYNIILADLNNDKILDIAVSDYGDGNGHISVFFGYGNGNFTLMTSYSTGWNSDPRMIGVCDFNHDNLLDLAINYQNIDTIGIRLQQKNEPFGPMILFSTGNNSHPESIVVEDFNNDNQSDIVIANTQSNTIGIFLGFGNGSFGEQQIYTLGNNTRPCSIASGHFNNDTYLDLVVANYETNTITILCGYGNGTVSILVDYFTGIRSQPSSVTVDDLNKDNYLDIIVTNFGSNEILIFYGLGNGLFSIPQSYSLGYNARPRSIAIGDMDHNNMLGIIVANYGTDYVEIFLQTC